MQLSKKLQMFYHFFTAFLKLTFNFEHLEKKDEPHSLFICEIIDGKKRADVIVWKVRFQYILGESTC